MPPNLSKTTVKFLVALLKNQAKLWLGEDAAGIAAQTLLDSHQPGVVINQAVYTPVFLRSRMAATKNPFPLRGKHAMKETLRQVEVGHSVYLTAGTGTARSSIRTAWQAFCKHSGW